MAHQSKSKRPKKNQKAGWSWWLRGRHRGSFVFPTAWDEATGDLRGTSGPSRQGARGRTGLDRLRAPLRQHDRVSSPSRAGTVRAASRRRAPGPTGRRGRSARARRAAPDVSPASRPALLWEPV